MARQRKTTIWVGGMLVVLGALALSACGGSSAAAKPTATPDAASIVTSAQKLQFTDLEFTMSLTGASSGTNVDGTFGGTETTSPQRSDITFSFSSAGQTFAGETITDNATSTTCTKLTSPAIPGISSDQWIKTTGAASVAALPVDPSEFTSLSGLTGTTLKGSEILDDIAVWHLQATDTIGGSNAQADLYVRQDNGQLYEVIANETGADSGMVTFMITGENTGKAVTLPPESEVVSA